MIHCLVFGFYIIVHEQMHTHLVHSYLSLTESLISDLIVVGIILYIVNGTFHMHMSYPFFIVILQQKIHMHNDFRGGQTLVYTSS